MQEIPGFFYDPIRKKYFADTPELQKKRAEEQMKNNAEVVPKSVKHNSFLTYLQRKELGNLYRYHFHFSRKRSISIHDFNHSLVDFAVISQQDSSFGCFGFKNGEFSIIGLDWSIERTKFIRTFAQEPSPVTRVAQSRIGEQLFLFVSYLGQGLESGHVDVYSSPDCSPDRLILLKEIQPMASRKPIWYCASSPESTQLLVGSSNCYYIYDLTTYQHSVVPISGQDVLYQKWKDKNVHFYGGRNAKLFMTDIRDRNSYSMWFQTPSPVSSIETDFMNVITFSTDGSVQLWDIRKPFRAIETSKFENQSQPITSALLLRKKQIVFSTDLGWIYFLDITSWTITSQKKWDQLSNEACVVRVCDDVSFHTGHRSILDTWSL
jgi:hypothetical protein